MKCEKRMRLRVLKVRHSGQRNSHGAFCQSGKCGDQARDALGNSLRRIFDKHPEIRGHQLISAAAGVQFVADGPDLLHQRSFYEMVDVFRRRKVQPGGIGLCSFRDGVEGRQRLLRFRGRQNAGLLYRASPGPVHRQFVGQQAPIEWERALEFVE